MRLRNLYTSPLTGVKLNPGENILHDCVLKPGMSYYGRIWVACSGGTATVSFGATSATFSKNAQLIGEYKPDDSTLKIVMKVVSGSPTVFAEDFTFCEDYTTTKKILNSLGTTRFSGNTMPLT